MKKERNLLSGKEMQTHHQKSSGVFKTIFICLSFLILSAYLQAQTSKIKVYFTKPVDNTFSTGINATYLNNTVFDTLAAYINRAKYTIDICQYEYETWTGDPIYTAINNAHSRGVKIRYIQDGSYASANTGVAALNASIPVVASPTTSAYGICHNKFVIIDEYAPDTTKAIVWTGSPDWTSAMTQGDYNNVIIFQSKQFAQAYTHEFNIMWGDTTHGGAYNATLSKFGPNKPNSGTHIFYIGGSKVELYFSPSDGVNNQIISNINSASVDLYCGMFTFTETTNANDIVARKNAGVFTAVILDKYSSGTYSPYTTTFPNGLGSNFEGYVSSNTLYHNKYMIVNPSARCDDPRVLTGSHNWTASADSKNDENTVIVHNDTIANVYLQAFAGDFKAINSSHTALATTTSTCAIATGITDNAKTEQTFNIFPNPCVDVVTVNVTNAGEKLSIKITDQLGETILEKEAYQTNVLTFSVSELNPGIYFISATSGNQRSVQKLVK